MKFIDFFAGVGGFRRGMELAGHDDAPAHPGTERVPGQNATETTAKRNIEGGIQKWRMVCK